MPYTSGHTVSMREISGNMAAVTANIQDMQCRDPTFPHKVGNHRLDLAGLELPALGRGEAPIKQDR